jgi:hypothetical protein
MTQGETAGLVVGWLIVIAICVLLSHVIAKAAERRGRSYWAFFWLSLLVSWVIMGIIVATLPNESESDDDFEESDLELVECPFCAETIKVKAKICKHCGLEVGEHLKEQREKYLEQKASEETEPKFDGPAAYCRNCGTYTLLADGSAELPSNCPECGMGEAFLELHLSEVPPKVEPKPGVRLKGRRIHCRSCGDDSPVAPNVTEMPDSCPLCGAGAAFVEVHTQ